MSGYQIEIIKESEITDDLISKAKNDEINLFGNISINQLRSYGMTISPAIERSKLNRIANFIRCNFFSSEDDLTHKILNYLDSERYLGSSNTCGTFACTSDERIY